jgi:hypothetical protein
MSTELFTELFINFDTRFEKDGVKSTAENDIEKFGSTFLKGGFGVLTLKAALSKLTEKELELLFQIDCSGSMSDICSDNRTKMQHILHTLKNMVLFLKENQSLKASITIHAFDDQIYKVVDRTPVNEDTCDKILAAIQKIQPRDSTNIEKALNDVSEYFSSTELPSNSEKVSIFMTDGQATSGTNDKTILRGCVNETITNVFIGFGVDHDAKLLKTISSGEKSSYYFIDKLEYAGLVYGEILHGLVYKFLEKVTISVTNGLIYNYKTNTWDTSLYAGNIVSEGCKFYQLTSDNPSECVVQVSGNKMSDDSEFSIIVPVQEERVDLTKYMYRQRTQEILFKVNEYYKNEDTDPREYIEKQNVIRALRKEMHDFFEELKKYIADNQLEQDILLKNLCDDIYICYRTLGKDHGFMYCVARESSQGQQRAYTATQLPDDGPEITETIFRGGIQRQNAFNRFHESEYQDEEDTTEIQHNLSAATQTPYRTQTMTGIMRSCSAGINVKELEEEQEEQETQVL